jgi:hypothetical protein
MAIDVAAEREIVAARDRIAAQMEALPEPT